MNSVIDGLTTYSYDATSQLTGADHTGQTDETFSYDANGNRTSSVGWTSSPSSYTVGTHNRILSDGTSTYTYDLEGNQTSKINIASGAKTEYTWNHANQLAAVTFKTSTNVVTKSVQYQYDALGRRIGKSVDDNGDGTMDRRESFIYDGAGLLADAAGSIHIAGPNGALNQAGWTDQMILSFTDADADGSQAAVLTTRNLYGPVVDQIFATESASGNPLWSLADHQGTPRDWATRSSSTGATSIAQHTRYTAFGAIASIVDGTGNPLAATAAPLPSFTGQLYDVDSGLMYYRARWYDPQLGKFLNDDPMGFAAGDANVSRVVGNKVATAVDPTGLWPPGSLPPSFGPGIVPIFFDPLGVAMTERPYLVQVRVDAPTISVAQQFFNGTATNSNTVNTGHTFVMIRPPQNNSANHLNFNHYWGYYPGDGFIASNGNVKFPDYHLYTHAGPVIPVSPFTASLMLTHIVAIRKSPGTYSILDNKHGNNVYHCTTFVCEVLKQGGIDLVPGFGNGRLIEPIDLVKLGAVKPVANGPLESGIENPELLNLYNTIGQAPFILQGP